MLEVKDLEKPTPDDNQLLVRVRARRQPLDGHFVRGMLLARAMGGGLRNRRTRASASLRRSGRSGRKNVTQSKKDEVFGARTGSLAQYICAKGGSGRLPETGDKLRSKKAQPSA